MFNCREQHRSLFEKLKQFLIINDSSIGRLYRPFSHPRSPTITEIVSIDEKKSKLAIKKRVLKESKNKSFSYKTTKFL